jgi:hypothetical protein
VVLVIFIDLAWSSRARVADPLPLRLSGPRWAWQGRWACLLHLQLLLGSSTLRGMYLGPGLPTKEFALCGFPPPFVLQEGEDWWCSLRFPSPREPIIVIPPPPLRQEDVVMLVHFSLQLCVFLNFYPFLKLSNAISVEMSCAFLNFCPKLLSETARVAVYFPQFA